MDVCISPGFEHAVLHLLHNVRQYVETLRFELGTCLVGCSNQHCRPFQLQTTEDESSDTVTVVCKYMSVTA